MKGRNCVLWSAIYLLGSCAGVLRAGEVAEDKLTSEIVGTWRMISAKYDRQENDLPNQLLALKHMTPTQMIWLRIERDSGNVVAMAGGPYTLSGNKLVEKPSYGMGVDSITIKDQTHTFTCRIVDGRWHHTGKLQNGLTIEEVYERVKGDEQAEAPAK